MTFVKEESANNERDLAWWQRTIIYHVYVPSYYDTNGDGIGDLRGKSIYILLSHSARVTVSIEGSNPTDTKEEINFRPCD